MISPGEIMQTPIVAKVRSSQGEQHNSQSLRNVRDLFVADD